MTDNQQMPDNVINQNEDGNTDNAINKNLNNGNHINLDAMTFEDIARNFNQVWVDGRDIKGYKF